MGYLKGENEMKKNWKAVLLVVAICLGVAAIAIGLIFPTLGTTVDPLSQFTTQRNCSFLSMPDVARAVCTDGTVWNVQQIGSPVPLP